VREHPKLVRIFWLFVPVITTMAVYFIEISRVSWFKQEIRQIKKLARVQCMCEELMGILVLLSA